jgi:putative flippase GtrA
MQQPRALRSSSTSGLFTVQLTLLGVPYLVAAAISFSVGTVLLYWGSTRYVFRFRRLGDSRKEFWAFLFIGVAGLAVNLLAVYLLVEYLKLHPLIAKVGAGAMTFLANFGFRRFLLFTPWREQQLPPRLDSATPE